LDGRAAVVRSVLPFGYAWVRNVADADDAWMVNPDGRAWSPKDTFAGYKPKAAA
jgi:hypothetical protein